MTNTEGRDLCSLDFLTGRDNTKVRGSEREREKNRRHGGKQKERELISLALPAKSVSIHRTNLLCDSHCGLTDSEW